MFSDTHHPEVHLRSLFRKLHKIRDAISFFSSKLPEHHRKRKMEEDLVRLEETSPHLLEDIGLSDDEPI